jgi:VIT1/CCC1 family predicted Fe2+/Mn2+ transporter/ribosomal protein S15P/S13E
LARPTPATPTGGEQRSSVKDKKISKEIQKALLISQANEITEHFVYGRLSRSIRDPHNKRVLKRISADEREHYNFWKRYTNQDATPCRWIMWKYYLLARIFGITFGIKLMERGEKKARITYKEIAKVIPSAKRIEKDEHEHEKALINLIDEERMRYVGSMVLGLNDALVELTGALAGFTLALQNTRLIAMAGFITGIAASLSMGASEYLSTKSEGGVQDPVKASLYTGSVYILTVLFLIFPYLIFANYYVCLGFMLVDAVVVIAVFTFYIAIAKDTSFGKMFLEMVGISLGIAALTFVIGFFVRMAFKIDI